MAHAVESCVHCGFCLPTCPTYVTLGEEMDSPRGRIFLMKEVLEGSVESRPRCPTSTTASAARPARRPAPRASPYGELLTPFRAFAEAQPPPRADGPPPARRSSCGRCPPAPLPRGRRLGRLARPLARVLPGRWRRCSTCCPSACRRARPLPEIFPARARAARAWRCSPAARSRCSRPTSTGRRCACSAHNGVEVVIPREPGLLRGARAAHGRRRRGRAPRARNMEAFPADVDAVITNAAGCGSGMREYGCCSTASRTRAAAALAGRGRRRHRVPRRARAPRRPAAAPADASPTTTPATWPTPRASLRAAPAAARDPRPELRRAGRVGAVLRLGRHLQHREARDRRQLGRRKADNLLDTGAQLIATGNTG